MTRPGRGKRADWWPSNKSRVSGPRHRRGWNVYLL